MTAATAFSFPAAPASPFDLDAVAAWLREIADHMNRCGEPFEACEAMRTASVYLASPEILYSPDDDDDDDDDWDDNDWDDNDWDDDDEEAPL